MPSPRTLKKTKTKKQKKQKKTKTRKQKTPPIRRMLTKAFKFWALATLAVRKAGPPRPGTTAPSSVIIYKDNQDYFNTTKPVFNM